ncbi:MAG: APC family permease [Candidatus Bathyarchaeia archaeon]
MGQPKGGPKVFTREATGLVRDVSIWDAFWFNNWTTGGPATTIIWMSTYPVWFPKADLVLALVITAIYSGFVGSMYVLIQTTMPRSGSDYVFVSRTLSPAIGLAFSLEMIFWLMMINSYNVYATFSVLSQALYSIGAMTGQFGLVSAWGAISGNSAGVLAVGLIIYLACITLVVFGIRRYMRFQMIATIISVIGLAIIFVAGIIYTNQNFVTNFNNVFSPMAGSPDPYHDVVNLATSAGYTPPSGFDWNQTVTVSALWYLISIAPMASSWMGGEIKKASSVKSQFIAMVGGQYFTMFLAAILVEIWLKLFTKDWLAAVGYLTINAPSKIPTWLAGASPYFVLPWINVTLNNAVLAAIVSIAFVVQVLLFITPLIIAASRHIFAWSFDRIIPTKLSEVNERVHSPVLAVLVIGVMTMLGYVFTVYTTYLNFAVGAVLGWMLALVIVSAAAIAFMWRRKDIYQLSVVSKLKLAGIPVMPLLGILSLGSMLIMIYYYVGPLAFTVGGFTNTTLEISFALFVIGIVGYYCAKAIQTRRGLPLELVFKEIPPE